MIGADAIVIFGGIITSKAARYHPHAGHRAGGENGGLNRAEKRGGRGDAKQRGGKQSKHDGVAAGLVLFFILRLTIGRAVSITGRPSPAFLIVGYGLIVFPGIVMVVQSLRPPRIPRTTASLH